MVKKFRLLLGMIGFFIADSATVSLLEHKIVLLTPLITTLFWGLFMYVFLAVRDKRSRIFNKLYEDQIISVKQKLTLDRDKELLDLERKHQDEIKNYQDQLHQVKTDAQKEIDKYQEKYQELLESIKQPKL